MTARELIEILEGYDGDAPVSICHRDTIAGQGVPQMAGVEMVADNAGPSIYAEGWDGE